MRRGSFSRAVDRLVYWTVGVATVPAFVAACINFGVIGGGAA